MLPGMPDLLPEWDVRHRQMPARVLQHGELPARRSLPSVAFAGNDLRNVPVFEREGRDILWIPQTENFLDDLWNSGPAIRL